MYLVKLLIIIWYIIWQMFIEYFPFIRQCTRLHERKLHNRFFCLEVRLYEWCWACYQTHCPFQVDEVEEAQLRRKSGVNTVLEEGGRALVEDEQSWW